MLAATVTTYGDGPLQILLVKRIDSEFHYKASVEVENGEKLHGLLFLCESRKAQSFQVTEIITKVSILL